MPPANVLSDIDSMFDDNDDSTTITNNTKPNQSTGLGNGLLRATKSSNSSNNSNGSIMISSEESESDIIQSFQPIKKSSSTATGTGTGTGISESQRQRRLKKTVIVDDGNDDDAQSTDDEAALIRHNKLFKQKQQQLSQLDQYRHNTNNNKNNGFYTKTHKSIKQSKPTSNMRNIKSQYSSNKSSNTSSSNRPSRRSTSIRQSYNESDGVSDSTDEDNNQSNDADDDDFATALQLSKQQARADAREKKQRLQQLPAEYRADVADNTSDIDIDDENSDDVVISKQITRKSSQSSSKYREIDTEDDLSDGELMNDDDDQPDDNTGEVLDEIETILGRRVFLIDLPTHNNISRSTPLKRTHSADIDVSTSKHGPSQYLIKYRERGYIHCDWLPVKELSKIDDRYQDKIRSWHRKEDKHGMTPHTLKIDPDLSYNPNDGLSHQDCEKLNCVAYGCDDQGEFFGMLSKC